MKCLLQIRDYLETVQMECKFIWKNKCVNIAKDNVNVCITEVDLSYQILKYSKERLLWQNLFLMRTQHRSLKYIKNWWEALHSTAIANRRAYKRKGSFSPETYKKINMYGNMKLTFSVYHACMHTRMLTHSRISANKNFRTILD